MAPIFITQQPLKEASTAQPGDHTPSMITITTFAMHGHVVNAGDAQLLRMANTPPGSIDKPTASIQASEGVFIIIIDEMTKSVFLWLENSK